MKSDNLVSFRHVNKRYTTGDEEAVVLKDVNFNIKKNAFTIIFGPSGSGKTTILNMIMGLLKPTSGQVFVDGYDMYSMSSNDRAKFRAKNFGSVYQTNNWINSLDVTENIALPLYLSGSDRIKAVKTARSSLMRVGMEKYANHYPSVLSVGQQQRVSMARATVSSPLLLVADEPTGNLDSKNGDMIMKLILSYRNEHNSTIILVTHNIDYLPLSDHRLFIQDGVVTEDEGGYQSDISASYNKVTAMLNLGRSAQKVNSRK
jgi:ABC-type lipoprotein export system ATPase subunit